MRDGGASLRCASVMLPAQRMGLFASVILYGFERGKADAYMGAVEGSPVQDLFELRQLTGQDALLRSMKEQAIGQHCCEAGESLNNDELASLKQALGLDEEQWRAYKSKVRPEPA